MPTNKTVCPRNGPGSTPGYYICGLCGKGFSRRYTVFESRFQGRVRENGNANDLPGIPIHPVIGSERIALHGLRALRSPLKKYKVRKDGNEGMA